MSDKNRHVVYVDVHEPITIYNALEGIGKIKPIRRKLDVGDYYIPASKYSALIERKTVSDFIDSMYDMRLSEELKRLKSIGTGESKLMLILLVEGSWSFIRTYGFKEKQVIRDGYASLLSVMTNLGIHVVSSPTRSWTPYIIASFTEWLGEPTELSPPAYRRKELTLDEIAINVLCSFPHISASRAKQILKHYGTLSKALKNVGWWKHSIRGIGDRVVKDIKKVLRHRVIVRRI